MGGGYIPPPTDTTTAEMLQSLIKYLPAYGETVRSQLLPTEQSKLDVSKVISPQMYEQLIGEYGKYGPQLSDIGQDIKRREQMGTIQSDLATLRGPGQEAADEALKLLAKADPEFYKQRGLIGDKIQEVLGASSATLSPTERLEMERSIARSNPRDTQSALSTASNAMQFGQAATAKANNLANIVKTVSSSLPALRSGADIYGVATGRAGLSSPGAQFFTGTNQPGEEGFRLGSGLFTNINQTEQNRQELMRAAAAQQAANVQTGISGGLSAATLIAALAAS